MKILLLTLTLMSTAAMAAESVILECSNGSFDVAVVKKDGNKGAIRVTSSSGETVGYDTAKVVEFEKAMNREKSIVKHALTGIKAGATFTHGTYSDALLLNVEEASGKPQASAVLAYDGMLLTLTCNR